MDALDIEERITMSALNLETLDSSGSFTNRLQKVLAVYLNILPTL